MKDNIFYYFYEKNTCFVIFSSYWLLQEALIFVLENDPVPCSPNKKQRKQNEISVQILRREGNSLQHAVQNLHCSMPKSTLIL